jgi:hypothetical protein
MEEQYLRRSVRCFLRARRARDEILRGTADTRLRAEAGTEPTVVSGSRRRTRACGTRSGRKNTIVNLFPKLNKWRVKGIVGMIKFYVILT